MRVSTLRSIIDQAFYHDKKTKRLQQHLKRHLKTLPNRLKIEPENEFS